jgi:glutamyl-tRNA synthetase
VPLIFGPDGKKLSKRHGATATADYQAMGYLAAGMRNYLARLGWSHGDMEVFTDAEAMAVFDLEGIGRSPARFDFKKLENLSGQHMARTPDDTLLRETEAFLAATGAPPLGPARRERLCMALPACKTRSKTIPQLLENAAFALTDRPIVVDEAAAKALHAAPGNVLADLTPQLQKAAWDRHTLEAVVTAAAQAHGTTLGKLAGPLRAALSGRATSPGAFDMMLVLGREETLARLAEAMERA